MSSYANGPKTVVVDAVRTIIIRFQSMTELIDETGPFRHGWVSTYILLWFHQLAPSRFSTVHACLLDTPCFVFLIQTQV